jgi:hypothetical protein
MYIQFFFLNSMYESKLQMKIVFKLENDEISLKVKNFYYPLQV